MELRDWVGDLGHSAHQGEDATKRQRRLRLWFPGMGKADERRVRTCRPCQASVDSKARDPLKPTKAPEEPGSSRHADHGGPTQDGLHIPVVIDGHTRYPEGAIVKGTGADDNIQAFSDNVNRHGVAAGRHNDNGTPVNGTDEMGEGKGEAGQADIEDRGAGLGGMVSGTQEAGQGSTEDRGVGRGGMVLGKQEAGQGNTEDRGAGLGGMELGKQEAGQGDTEDRGAGLGGMVLGKQEAGQGDSEDRGAGLDEAGPGDGAGRQRGPRSGAKRYGVGQGSRGRHKE